MNKKDRFVTIIWILLLLLTAAMSVRIVLDTMDFIKTESSRTYAQ